MANVNHNSEITETVENTPGEMTPIMIVEPENGTGLQFRNQVPQGSATGLPIYADLVDVNGDPLPVDTSIVLTAKQPGDAKRSAVSNAEDNISAYNNKSISEQQDALHVDSVKHELKGAAVNVRDIDEFAVEIETDVAIDWSQSSLYFERQGVREFQRG